MSGNFFDNYKDFIVVPVEDKKDYEEVFNPQDYAHHFIITFSLYYPLISCWKDAKKYDIDIEKSLQKVIRECNKKQKGSYYLQVLELEDDTSYFVLALSCNSRIENEEEFHKQISSLFERMLSNPLYVGESWYRLIDYTGRVERTLFTFTYKKYEV